MLPADMSRYMNLKRLNSNYSAPRENHKDHGWKTSGDVGLNIHQFCIYIIVNGKTLCYSR